MSFEVACRNRESNSRAAFYSPSSIVLTGKRGVKRCDEAVADIVDNYASLLVDNACCCTKKLVQQLNDLRGGWPTREMSKILDVHKHETSFAGAWGQLTRINELIGYLSRHISTEDLLDAASLALDKGVVAHDRTRAVHCKGSNSGHQRDFHTYAQLELRWPGS